MRISAKLPVVFLAVSISLGIAPQHARAVNITMTASNAVGTSGFNSGTGWPGGVAPAGGNNYSTAAFVLRTSAN